MKKILFSFLFIILLFGCSKDGIKYSNPYLPNNPVYISIDLNLPEYSKLEFSNESVIVKNRGGALPGGGVVIFNAGSYYVAFDIACPNHQILNCSEMIRDGASGSIYISCHCSLHKEPLKYSLITGTSMTEGALYQMKPYPVTRKGNTIYVQY